MIEQLVANTGVYSDKWFVTDKLDAHFYPPAIQAHLRLLTLAMHAGEVHRDVVTRFRATAYMIANLNVIGPRIDEDFNDPKKFSESYIKHFLLPLGARKNRPLKLTTAVIQRELISAGLLQTEQLPYDALRMYPRQGADTGYEYKGMLHSRY